MSNRKPRSPSVNKLKGPVPGIIIQPQSPLPPKKRIELTRSCKISIQQEGEKKEFNVSFEELEVGDLLGRGQFGTVKKMKHKSSGITFAVKMINDNVMESNDSRNSEIMDLTVPIKLGDGCPFLIKFYGAIHAESYIWILTEVMDTSLDRFYAKLFALELQMPELFMSKLAFAVISSLEYMRSLKLMHRDIKPSNILINSNAELKVCDFGISGFTTNSVCSTFKGCQRYMPPEKIDPSLTGSGYTIKADIWSLGISLIEIATGTHPFANAVGFLGLIKSIAQNDPPKLDSSKFSPEFCTFIDKCLMKKADDRGSCEELLKEPFIEKYVNESNDLKLIERVITAVKEDVVEP